MIIGHLLFWIHHPWWYATFYSESIIHADTPPSIQHFFSLLSPWTLDQTPITFCKNTTKKCHFYSLPWKNSNHRSRSNLTFLNMFSSLFMFYGRRFRALKCDSLLNTNKDYAQKCARHDHLHIKVKLGCCQSLKWYHCKIRF